jgi:hypothetical protein
VLIRGLGCQCNLCTPTCLSDIVPSDRHASRHTGRKKSASRRVARRRDQNLRAILSAKLADAEARVRPRRYLALRMRRL